VGEGGARVRGIAVRFVGTGVWRVLELSASLSLRGEVGRGSKGSGERGCQGWEAIKGEDVFEVVGDICIEEVDEGCVVSSFENKLVVLSFKVGFNDGMRRTSFEARRCLFEAAVELFDGCCILIFRDGDEGSDVRARGVDW
jgi:hypothetical protein